MALKLPISLKEMIKFQFSFSLIISNGNTQLMYIRKQFDDFTKLLFHLRRIPGEFSSNAQHIQMICQIHGERNE